METLYREVTICDISESMSLGALLDLLHGARATVMEEGYWDAELVMTIEGDPDVKEWVDAKIVAKRKETDVERFARVTRDARKYIQYAYDRATLRAVYELLKQEFEGGA